MIRKYPKSDVPTSLKKSLVGFRGRVVNFQEQQEFTEITPEAFLDDYIYRQTYLLGDAAEKLLSEVGSVCESPKSRERSWGRLRRDIELHRGHIRFCKINRLETLCYVESLLQGDIQ